MPRRSSWARTEVDCFRNHVLQPDGLTDSWKFIGNVGIACPVATGSGVRARLWRQVFTCGYIADKLETRGHRKNAADTPHGERYVLRLYVTSLTPGDQAISAGGRNSLDPVALSVCYCPAQQGGTHLQRRASCTKASISNVPEPAPRGSCCARS